MGQILVRNLDDMVIERLKAMARSENTSLEQTVRQLLIDATKPSRNEIWAEIDRVREKIGPISGDSTALIREDRDNDEPYLVDASVALKWFVAEDGSLEAADLRQRPISLTAPELILAEIGNALWKRKRRGEINSEGFEAASAALGLPFLEFVGTSELAGPALTLATELDHPIYDCFYLALAQRDASPLATADRKLAGLAQRIGIEAELIGKR